MKEEFGFITTKLKMPAPRRNYIVRPLLHKKLEEILQYKVTMVKGAAGSGKTTLLTSYIREKGLTSFKWITLDEDNNNLFSFWHYFLEAVKGFLGESRDDILSSFKAAFHRADMDPLLTLLVNQLDIQEEIVVILDDFQKIRDASLIQTIEFFIKYASDNLHLVLLTREETALYTGDLAMSGKLQQIDEDDLKLSEAEAMNFLKKTLQVELDDAVLRRICLMAEGWMGGIQLVALASAGKNQLIRDIKVLSKPMVDYLSREILDSLEKDEREFLIKTSVLNYFSEEICSRFLGTANCGKLIAGLMNKNLFIIQVDEEQGIYRYHAIFSEFLRHQFSVLEQEEKVNLHRKASEVFEAVGDLEESIRHLFQIGRYKEAMIAISKMEQGPVGWALLSCIPMEYIKEDRDLAYQRFFYHYCNMEWDQCKNLLEAAKDKIERDISWKALKFAKAFIYDVDLEIDVLSMDEIETMQFSDTTKAIIYIKTATLLHIQDRNREALNFIDKAAVLENKLNNPYIQYFIASMRSQVKEDLGDLLECEALYRETLALIDKYAFLSPLAENYCIGITGIYLKRMELDKAEKSLQEAAEHTGKSILNTDIAYLYNMMELKVLKGEKEEALGIIKKIMDTFAGYKLVYASGMIKYMMYLGHLDRQLLDELVSSYESTDNRYTRFDDRLMYAWTLDLRGQKKEALERMDEVLQTTRKTKTKYKLVEAILLKIRMLGDAFDLHRREICNLWREAIYYSHADKILSPYMLAGEQTVKTLAAVQEEIWNSLSLKEKDFLAVVLNRFNKNTKSELLSEREIEVLCQLATGASNKEIGQRLCISVSTVKTHIINIYSKLQVGGRVEAVEQARKLKLIALR